VSIYDKLGISEEVAEFFAMREKNAILEERCAQLEERLGEARHATTQQVNVAFQGMEMAKK
jgi:BMFP domain-containing protein YqiC